MLLGVEVDSCFALLEAVVVEVEVVDVSVVEVGTATVVSSRCGLTQSMSHNEIRLVKMGRISRVPCCFDVFMTKNTLSLREPRISNLIPSQISMTGRPD